MAVVTAFQNQQTAHPLAQTMLLGILCGLSVAAAVGAGRGRRLPPWVLLVCVQVLVSLCALRAARFEASLDLAGSDLLAQGLAWSAALVTLVAAWGRRSLAAWAFWVALAMHAVVLIMVVEATPYIDDVPLYVLDALRDLTHGHSPYGGSVPNPFDAHETAKYLAPQLVSDGRILIGFPYLPATLVMELPGYLLGDYRLSHVAALVLLAVVWRRLAVDEVGRCLGLLAVVSPYTARLVGAGWVEPVVMLGIGTMALAMVRGWRTATVISLAFLLASKQYVATVIGFLIPVWRRSGASVVVTGVGSSAALVLAFWAWGPRDFWRDVVEFQPLQPYRPESVSLLVTLSNHFDTMPPSWVMTALPLVTGLLVSAYVGHRSPPGATSTVAALSLGFLASALLSKMAHPNYFFMISAGLVTVAISWPIDGEPPVSEDSGSRRRQRARMPSISQRGVSSTEA